MSISHTRPAPESIQGIVMRGYSHPYSSHLLFRFGKKSKTGNFVKAVQGLIQSAGHWGDEKPRYMLNIGFTHRGLIATQVPAVRYDLFPVEYRLGPTSYYAQQSLGDKGSSAPPEWAFGGTEGKMIDMVVHCYALDEGAHDEVLDKVLAAASEADINELKPLSQPQDRLLGNPEMGAFIHFGYRDGINQPVLNWPDPWPAEGEYTPTDALNNFLVGYPNSSVFPGPNFDPDNSSHLRIDYTKTNQFAKNGCYYVFRLFQQDVHGFEDFLSQNAPMVAERRGCTEEEAKEWIAAKLNGRWRDGSPLEVSPEHPSPEHALTTEISYSFDREGLKCPFSAHTRVSNPRDQQVFRTDLPVPRIIRRGVAYGPKNPPAEFAGEQGLIGLFLCGSISLQFEKVNGWINANNFSDVFTLNPQDPLVGNRDSPQIDTRFEIPMDDGKGSIFLDTAGYQFVRTRGTAYCFFPSIEALNMIAETAD